MESETFPTPVSSIFLGPGAFARPIHRSELMRPVSYALAFFVSFAIVYLLIPPLGKLAFRLDFVDKPRKDVERKVHRDRKSTRLNSSHIQKSRMPSSA